MPVLALAIIPAISIAIWKFERFLRELSHKTQAAVATVASSIAEVRVGLYGANLTIMGTMSPGDLTSFILFSLTGKRQMGNPSAEVTEDDWDATQLAKSKAMDAMSEGRLYKAIDQLTKAILLNPQSVILYATRASIFIKLKKPNAAIRDANTALKINPDSAKGYKIRGMTWAMLGLWEKAVNDLHVAKGGEES